ncbi:SLAP domain protein [Lactobacillus kullabergensis]|uniref:SLAP domain protein n=1 Tax=Lactobacillus kullabergensis TaxID=1218493 RepID=A0A0F4LN92_9LACO|nr:SLAP domain-containing protein [Lactobacillus kullabergensis]KJY59041.1 SLAP domain protein [Lactobacillus kullabergensis]
MKKNKLCQKLAIAFCSVALTTVGAAVIVSDTVHTINATPNHKGFNNWIQYGTLKYALKGPSGRVYPAGTKVARYMGNLTKPSKLSYPALPFALSLSITSSPIGITQFGGGDIAEAYVNLEDWQEIDDPDVDSFGTDIVESTFDKTDLASRDFHPVDSNNPDVPVANTDALDHAYGEYLNNIDFEHRSKADKIWEESMNKRYSAAKGMGVSQSTVDALTKEINDAIANHKKTGHFVSGSSDSSNASNSGSSNSSNSTAKPSTSSKSKSRVVKLRKASYRYTRKGKRVSKKLLKKGSYVKINGKTYRIKGKTFYRIGKNRYIRKVNVAK